MNDHTNHDTGEVLRREFLSCGNLHIRENPGGEEPSRTITGYAILFDTPSAVLWADEDSEAREVIAPEAVTRELLDSSDIKFTMFHDRQLILARSRQGHGSLRYSIDERGVCFEFEAPRTAEGDKALEAIRRGDIAGCSFAFSTRYWDKACVERSAESSGGGRVSVTYRVKAITGIYDMTLAADPAYPDTSVEARELRDSLGDRELELRRKDAAVKKAVSGLRSQSCRKIF